MPRFPGANSARRRDERDLDVDKRYRSLVRGWAQEQREGPIYWLQSHDKQQAKEAARRRDG
jgi:hypothetical protein